MKKVKKVAQSTLSLLKVMKAFNMEKEKKEVRKDEPKSVKALLGESTFIRAYYSGTNYYS